MSACQSPASSCATTPTLTPPAQPLTWPAGTDPMVISDSVVSKVAKLIAEEGDPGLQLRIFVTGGGCSGFQYGFAFDDERKADDVRVEKGPVTVVVDPMSLQYLVGAQIDYEDKLEGARFVIRNPNAATTCNCGSSFSV